MEGKVAKRTILRHCSQIMKHMELGFNEFFTSYEMELETHGHVQIGNQLGFHEHQFACYH